VNANDDNDEARMPNDEKNRETDFTEGNEDNEAPETPG
jgi:hypothetical protein